VLFSFNRNREDPHSIFRADVVLEAGDVLVLEATLDFKPYFEQSHHFALISEKRSGSLTPRRVSFSMFFVCALVVGMIALRYHQPL
jgi:hypothetical protein